GSRWTLQVTARDSWGPGEESDPLEFEVGEEESDPGVDDDDSVTGQGCGCAAAPGAGPWVPSSIRIALLLLVVGLVRRRGTTRVAT
ncbi:MAG: hypothetical protein VX498_03395, partial [Myxococcota bacterium]|nr:hypothetical protein [Myxococcota bacterium]